MLELPNSSYSASKPMTQSAQQNRFCPFWNAAAPFLLFKTASKISIRFSDVVGTDRVVPGTALIGSEVQAPGVIHVMTQIRKVVFGEITGQKTARAERINDVFRSAGIDSEITSEISKLLWQKMVWFCGFAGMCSIIRLPVGKLMSYPETREMFKQIMEEVDEVAKAKGVDVGRDYIQNRIDFADHLEKNGTPSMMRDLLAGRKLELDALNGTVIRMGKEQGIATPMNWAVYSALKPYVTPRVASVGGIGED